VILAISLERKESAAIPVIAANLEIRASSASFQA
jgi:hypothetical protein